MKAIFVMLAAASGLTLAAADGRTESWPAKPVRAIVAAGAGSTIDIVPRVVLEQLAAQFGQSIVVENRAGAGGTIGAGAVAKADPDGYTVLVNSNAHTIAPSLYANLGYHPTRDFAGVISFGVLPSVMVVPPAKGWKTVRDVLNAAKARPDGLNFPSVGVGSATHLSAERFRASAKVQAVHVPFKGGGEAMTEIIAGRLDFFFGPVGLVAPNIKEGKLVALAVNTSRRSSALPDVPTLREAGIADAEYPFWVGLFVPAKTPRAIVDKLHSETLKALQTPKVREKLAAMGVEPMNAAPAEFDALVASEIPLNAALVKSIGLKPAQ